MTECTVGMQIWIGIITGAVVGFAVGMLTDHTLWLNWKNKHIGWTIGKDGAVPPIDSETSEVR